MKKLLHPRNIPIQWNDVLWINHIMYTDLPQLVLFVHF
jgi:hypothetical protein